MDSKVFGIGQTQDIRTLNAKEDYIAVVQLNTLPKVAVLPQNWKEGQTGDNQSYVFMPLIRENSQY